VAFALPRPIGSAVTRNRLRRRLRALLDELEPSLPGGLLLIGAKQPATELTFAELRVELTQLLRTVSVATL
jgi:ribonuclease P protein component